MNSTPKFRQRTMWQAAACAAIFVLASVPGFSAPPNARKIMVDVYLQDTSRGTSMRANFEVTDKQGHRTKKEFTYRRIGSPGDSKTLVVFTAPEEIRGVVRNNGGGHSNHTAFWKLMGPANSAGKRCGAPCSISGFRFTMATCTTHIRNLRP